MTSRILSLKMPCFFIPEASSIQSGQERSGWRKARSRSQGNLGPQTGPPSGGIPASAVQKTSHPTACSRPWLSRSSRRTEWSGGASSSSVESLRVEETKSEVWWREREWPDLCAMQVQVWQVCRAGCAHPPDRNRFFLVAEPLPSWLSFILGLALKRKMFSADL